MSQDDLVEASNLLRDVRRRAFYLTQPPQPDSFHFIDTETLECLKRQAKEIQQQYDPLSEENLKTLLKREMLENGLKENDWTKAFALASDKQEHQRNRCLSTPLLQLELAAVMIHCNYDNFIVSCKQDQRKNANNWTKWKVFNYLLERVISKLAKQDDNLMHHKIAKFSGLFNVSFENLTSRDSKESSKSCNHMVQMVALPAVMSFSDNYKVAADFCQGHGAVVGISADSHVLCCDISWISMFSKEREFLVSQLIPPFFVKLVDKSKSIQHIQLIPVPMGPIELNKQKNNVPIPISNSSSKSVSDPFTGVADALTSFNSDSSQMSSFPANDSRKKLNETSFAEVGLEYTWGLGDSRSRGTSLPCQKQETTGRSNINVLANTNDSLQRSSNATSSSESSDGSVNVINANLHTNDKTGQLQPHDKDGDTIKLFACFENDYQDDFLQRKTDQLLGLENVDNITFSFWSFQKEYLVFCFVFHWFESKYNTNCINYLAKIGINASTHVPQVDTHLQTMFLNWLAPFWKQHVLDLDRKRRQLIMQTLAEIGVNKDKMEQLRKLTTFDSQRFQQALDMINDASKLSKYFQTMWTSHDYFVRRQENNLHMQSDLYMYTYNSDESAGARDEKWLEWFAHEQNRLSLELDSILLYLVVFLAIKMCEVWPKARQQHEIFVERNLFRASFRLTIIASNELFSFLRKQWFEIDTSCLFQLLQTNSVFRMECINIQKALQCCNVLNVNKKDKIDEIDEKHGILFTTFPSGANCAEWMEHWDKNVKSDAALSQVVQMLKKFKEENKDRDCIVEERVRFDSKVEGGIATRIALKLANVMLPSLLPSHLATDFLCWDDVHVPDEHVADQLVSAMKQSVADRELCCVKFKFENDEVRDQHNIASVDEAKANNDQRQMKSLNFLNKMFAETHCKNLKKCANGIDILCYFWDLQRAACYICIAVNVSNGNAINMWNLRDYCECTLSGAELVRGKLMTSEMIDKNMTVKKVFESFLLGGDFGVHCVHQVFCLDICRLLSWLETNRDQLNRLEPFCVGCESSGDLDEMINLLQQKRAIGQIDMKIDTLSPYFGVSCFHVSERYKSYNWVSVIHTLQFHLNVIKLHLIESVLSETHLLRLAQEKKKTCAQVFSMLLYNKQIVQKRRCYDIIMFLLWCRGWNPSLKLPQCPSRNKRGSGSEKKKTKRSRALSNDSNVSNRPISSKNNVKTSILFDNQTRVKMDGKVFQLCGIFDSRSTFDGSEQAKEVKEKVQLLENIITDPKKESYNVLVMTPDVLCGFCDISKQELLDMEESERRRTLKIARLFSIGCNKCTTIFAIVKH